MFLIKVCQYLNVILISLQELFPTISSMGSQGQDWFQDSHLFYKQNIPLLIQQPVQSCPIIYTSKMFWCVIRI